MPIKWCKIQYLNLHKALLFLRNQAICLKNLKLWRAPSTIKFNIFCYNFAHVSVLSISAKRCARFFFILFRSWVFDKPDFCDCVETRSFLILTNNSSSKKIKSISHTLLYTLLSRERVQNFNKNHWSLVVGARQSFQFLRQNTSFLENNRALSEFLYGILHYLISIIKL